MKKFLVIFWISIPIFCFFQYNIILKNGNEVYCKVSKFDSESITYKKHSNLSGPEYVISMDKVFMIKHENGDKNIFNNSSTKNDKIIKDVDWSKFTHIVLNQGIVGEGQALTGGMVLISPLATAISNHNTNSPSNKKPIVRVVIM